MDEIKTCPFCGAKAALAELGLGKYCVACLACGCRTPVHYVDTIAIRTWNRRNGQYAEEESNGKQKRGGRKA